MGWILAVALCVVLPDVKSFATIADWASYAASASLQTTGFVAPHVGTFQRVQSLLDAEARDLAIGSRVQTQVQSRVIAVDDKEARGLKTVERATCTSWPRWTTRPALSLDWWTLAWEPPRSPDSVHSWKPLGGLEGRSLTIDALQTLASHYEFLHECSAYFVMTVKGNQSKLLKQLKDLPSKQLGNQQQDTGHGRRNIRRIKAAWNQVSPRPAGRTTDP